MQESLGTYPEHIDDPVRIELATTILEKETRKLYLGLPDGAWPAVDQSIRGWAEHPMDYHLENAGTADFWDNFAAVMESAKLKPNFTAWITAENVHWSKVTLPVRGLHMTNPLEQLQQIPGLNLRRYLPFVEIIDELDAADPAVRSEQKELIDQHSTDPAQDDYPIIVRKTASGLLEAMDGNRRTLKAAIYGRYKIDAWVGELDGSKPENFWVPLNDMYQILKVYHEATDNNDQQLQQAASLVLRARFRSSAVAERAYQRHIGIHTDIARQLFSLTQMLP